MSTKTLTDPLAQTGDLHNFGKQTHLVKLNGRDYFKKYRSLFWENLFLGAQSPLRSIIGNVLGDECAQGAMGLHFAQPEHPHLGFAEKFQGFQHLAEIPKTPWYYRTVGKQVAYFSVFGVSDILLENIKIHAQGIQLIDLECLFDYNLCLEEMALLPYPDTEFNGKYGLFPFLFRVGDSNLVGHFACGLIEGILTLKYHQEIILKTLQKEISNHSAPIPIRVLLRSTAIYDLYLSEGLTPLHPFIPSERQQLERGEIPYFFKYIGEPLIRFYKNEEYENETADLSLLTTGFITARSGCDPAHILSEIRLDVMLKRALRSLRHWTAIGTKHTFSYESENLTVTLQEKRAHIVYGDSLNINYPI